MAARAEGATRKAPTLEPARLLSIATEEYHNSREVNKSAILPEGQDAAIEEAAATVSKEKDLSPEIRKEVRQVTQRLMTSLAESGEEEVNPQQVYEWALQVTLRRHKLGDFLEEESQGNTLTMTEMQKAAFDMSGQVAADKDAAFVPSVDVLNLSPKEFEENLEGNVRQLLLNATSDCVGGAISSLPGKAWKDPKAAASMRSALISEFAPIADILMEAIVSKDFDRWSKTMKIQGSPSPAQTKQFEKLHDEFQAVLNSEITPTVVQGICQAVVAADEVHDMMRKRAVELSKLGNQKKLTESSSEDEAGGPDEEAQDDFGGDAF